MLNIGVLEDFLIYIKREILFTYMKHNKIGEFNKLILRRKVRSTLSVSSFGGKNKQIQIEVRKKRTYVQNVLQDTNHFDSKNKVDFETNDKVITDVAVVQDPLVVNKEVKLSESVFLSSKALVQKDNNHSEFVVFQNKTILEKNNSNNTIAIKPEQPRNKIRAILSKKIQESHQSQYVKITDNVINSNDVNKSCYISTLTRKDNDKKMENERRYRSRGRAKYKPGGNNSRLIKQKRSNNYLYGGVFASTISVSDYSDMKGDKETQLLCVSNRVNKNKRKQSNSTLIQSFNKPEHTIVHNIVIGETIRISELASKMSIKGSYVIKVMMKLGFMATINQIIDQETAQLIVEEMGHNVILRRENELEESIMNDRVNMNLINNNNNNNSFVLENRAPIVTVMGHVDHGKTSLLDYVRSTKIASSEAGGITQSIGAYHVHINNNMITFIDTPGHAAFTAMRVRGAQLTDIVVLVVAADDGVMPQTIEAIKHAKSANVPIVVAINKIDKLEANPERIQNELSKYGVISEKWGGDVQFVNVSAISGKGIDSLLDAILLQSEMLELKVAHHGMANAVVIDSFIDKGRGPVVAVLVREGTLKCGDIVLCGTEYGRVRAMRDEYGCNVVSVGPSVPVELLGLSGTPIAGEMAIVVRDEKKAREVAFYRQGKFREVKLARREKISNLGNVCDDVKNISIVSSFASITELFLIIKASTQGFVEAIHDALLRLSTNEIKINIVSASIGGITETDTSLAMASNAIILGFNVRADFSARRIIESAGLDVRYYAVIYDLLDEVKHVMRGMLLPKYKFETIGLAEVRNVFFSPKHGNIAGCMVIEGMIKRCKKIRIIRNNIVIYDGELESLRRFKNDVNEVKSGTECGIGIKNYNDISSGDIIEVFDTIKMSQPISADMQKT